MHNNWAEIHFYERLVDMHSIFFSRLSVPSLSFLRYVDRAKCGQVGNLKLCCIARSRALGQWSLYIAFKLVSCILLVTTSDCIGVACSSSIEANTFPQSLDALHASVEFHLVLSSWGVGHVCKKLRNVLAGAIRMSPGDGEQHWWRRTDSPYSW